MTFPPLRISGRTIAMAYLCIAILAPSMTGIAVQREATVREEMQRETARQLFVQAIASGIAHSASSMRAALSVLAIDAATSHALSGDDLDVVETRFRRTMQAVGMKQIELRAADGRSVLRVTSDDAASNPSPHEGADLRFHHAVHDADLVVGEVVGIVSVTTLVDTAAYSQSLGRVALNSRDGRVLADPEGAGRGEILDIAEIPGTARSLVETGTSTVGWDTSVAFSVAGDVPIVVTATAATVRPAWPWWSLVVLDGLLLAVGWLVVASTTSTQAAKT